MSKDKQTVVYEKIHIAISFTQQIGPIESKEVKRNQIIHRDTILPTVTDFQWLQIFHKLWFLFTVCLLKLLDIFAMF